MRDHARRHRLGRRRVAQAQQALVAPALVGHRLVSRQLGAQAAVLAARARRSRRARASARRNGPPRRRWRARPSTSPPAPAPPRPGCRDPAWTARPGSWRSSAGDDRDSNSVTATTAPSRNRLPFMRKITGRLDSKQDSTATRLRAAGSARRAPGRCRARPRTRACPTPSRAARSPRAAARRGSCSCAPPPVSTMPRSTMSAASSGGVRSSTERTASTIWLTGSDSGFADLVAVDDQRLRHAGDEIAPLDLHGRDFVDGVGVADLLLDDLGGALADQQVVLALDVGDDRLVHLVARDADRLRHHDAGQRDDGDLGGAAADVDDHVARSAR